MKTDADSPSPRIFDFIFNDFSCIYAVKEKVQDDTPFGKIEVDKYVFKAYDENGNEIPDYPFLPQSPIINQYEDEGFVVTADCRQFPIKK